MTTLPEINKMRWGADCSKPRELKIPGRKNRLRGRDRNKACSCGSGEKAKNCCWGDRM